MSDCAIQGFKVLSMRYSSTSTTDHKLYIKEHSVREYSEDKPPGRTLFVLNVPPFVNQEMLCKLFSNVGCVDLITLQEKPSSSENSIDANDWCNSKIKKSYKVAYVVFKSKSDLIKALNIKNLPPIYDEENKSANGIISWIKEYNMSIPNIQKMKKDIESFMKKYDEQNKEKMENDKSLGEPDDDGWITVTKQSKKKIFERKETVGNKILAKEKTRQNKKELKNFYTFQIRESKMKHIVALRQKFEEDKKKITQLKESRRFRPF